MELFCAFSILLISNVSFIVKLLVYVHQWCLILSFYEIHDRKCLFTYVYWSKNNKHISSKLVEFVRMKSVFKFTDIFMVVRLPYISIMLQIYNLKLRSLSALSISIEIDCILLPVLFQFLWNFQIFVKNCNSICNNFTDSFH